MATNILETMSTSASSGDGSVRLNEVAKHLDQVTLEPRGHDVPNPTVPTQLEVALHGGDTIYEDEEPQTQLDASASLEIE